MRLNFNEAKNLIMTCGATNTVLLRGRPGIGKSSLLSAVAQEMPDYMPCYLDAAILDLGDVGMPVVDRDKMVTHYAPNARFGAGRDQHRPVLLMLDELGKASRAVINMLMPVILDRRIGDVMLPPGSIVFGTTNLDSDGVGDNIPAQAYNRMTVSEMAGPQVDEWLMWAALNDIAPEVMYCAREYPQMFECYTDIDKDAKNPYIFNPRTGSTKCFTSPRSLHKASHLIKARDRLGSALLPALAGTVGESAARDMEAMVSLTDSMPTWDQVVTNPLTVRLPDEMSAAYLMAFRLAGRAQGDTLDAVVQYVNRWTSFEATMLFVTQLASNISKVGMANKNRTFTELAARMNGYL